MPTNDRKDPAALAATDAHVDDSGARVPTPDPKDQTGDPDETNPAMRELRQRQERAKPANGDA